MPSRGFVSFKRLGFVIESLRGAPDSIWREHRKKRTNNASLHESDTHHAGVNSSC